jgi:hypothetical protein
MNDRPLMRIMNYLMIGLFVYSTVVQLNDPNPVPWMLLYLVALGFCVLWAYGKMPVIPAFAFSAACLVAGLIFLWIALNRDVWAWDARVNEAAGPIVVFLWVSSLAWLEWKKKALS